MAKSTGYYVYHMVMEGDNYAGGWVEHRAEISELWQVKNYQRVKRVVPFTVETSPEVEQGAINEAIAQHDAKKKAADKQSEIKRLEEQLNKLKMEK